MLRRVVAAVAVACGAIAVPAAAQADDHAVGFPAGPAAGPYTPADVEANPGDTVTFSGGSFAAHPLAWDTGDFARTGAGATATFTFAKPGLFRFHCEIHASMTGSVHVAGNQFATPDFTWAPAAPLPGQAVTFRPTAFADPDGSIARYEWDLDGNGSFESTGAQVARTYASAATVSVKLRYVDDGHETSPATARAVTVGGGAGGGGTPSGGGAPPAGGGSTPTAPSGSGGGAGSTPTAPSGSGGGESQGGGSAPASATAPGVRLTTRTLAFRRSAATVSLSAAAPATAKVTLRAGKAVLALGTARIHPGTAHVRVKLTRAGAKRLRTGRPLRASLAAVLRSASGDVTTVRRTVTVRLKR
ncbi:MAG TPA: PKD domain-containing protein [Baekduia sp.]|uniref:PKD domain-containing protein n=1 Tax=Baekduia sp. TaxID=2600305 RepID=UPI002CB3016C|nr:PKD domain-containing protein [Baekduia sp.]HMJ37063.1 PKD domain-containing protein [Baekduia sp.]